MDTLIYRQYGVKPDDMEDYLMGSSISDTNDRILLKNGIICNINRVILSIYTSDINIYLIDIGNKYIIIQGDCNKYYYTRINDITYNVLNEVSNTKITKKAYTFITNKGFKCSYIDSNLIVDILSNTEEIEFKSEMNINLVSKDIEYIRGITVGLLLKVFSLYTVNIIPDNISGIIYYKDRRVYYNELLLIDSKGEITLEDILTAEIRISTFIRDIKSIKDIALEILKNMRGYLKC